MSHEQIIPWEIQNSHITKIKIEKLEAFEEKLGISIENICINPQMENGGQIKVHFDVMSKDGGPIPQSVTVKFLAYDKEGRVTTSNYEIIDSDCFLGFDAMSTCLYGENFNVMTTDRIRILPTL